MTAFFGAELVIACLMLGSFVNLAADRLPRGESVVRPRSHCRRCGRRLNAMDLIPVLGYFVRGGRCATCRVAIGASSPLIEATCGAIMLSALIWLGPWPGTLLGLASVVLFSCTIIAFVVRRSRGAAAMRRGSRTGKGSAPEHHAR